jgi:hypothetical protein
LFYFSLSCFHLVGRYLSDGDVASLESFVYELVFKGLVPYLEKRVAELNEVSFAPHLSAAFSSSPLSVLSCDTILLFLSPFSLSGFVIYVLIVTSGCGCRSKGYEKSAESVVWQT